jgi:hypothetical protein
MKDLRSLKRHRNSVHKELYPSTERCECLCGTRDYFSISLTTPKNEITNNDICVTNRSYGRDLARRTWISGHDEQEYLKMRFWGGRTHTRMITPDSTSRGTSSVAKTPACLSPYGHDWGPICPFDRRLVPPVARGTADSRPFPGT